MGQQMLEAAEILEAINAAASNWENTSFSRSLSQENPLKYVKSFYEDANGKNPARAFHGSFAGRIEVNSVITVGNLVTTNMTLIMTDYMTATSGTRASGTTGGYGPNPLAIYPNANPYGPNGQFRTITVNYNMKIIVVR